MQQCEIELVRVAAEEANKQLGKQQKRQMKISLPGEKQIWSANVG